MYRPLCVRRLAVDRLLLGTENGLTLIQFGYMMSDMLLPSTPIAQSPHVALLKSFDERQEAIFDPAYFEQTPYYLLAKKCIENTGCWHVGDPKEIHLKARHFIKAYQQAKNGLIDQSPVLVWKIRDSFCYAVVDGHHKTAIAAHLKWKTVKCRRLDRRNIITPLQDFLLNSSWLEGRREIYQPLASPELEGKWVQVRHCHDRLNAMAEFLERKKIAPSPDIRFLDVACNIGFFVKGMEERGYDSYGVERDKYALKIGELKMALKPEKLIHSDIPSFLERETDRYDVISCMSLLHHYINNEMARGDPVKIIKNIDRLTGKVLFFETGQDHEAANAIRLRGWNEDYIVSWLKEHTSFRDIVPINKDRDNKGYYKNLYGRTLFACMR